MPLRQMKKQIRAALCLLLITAILLPCIVFSQEDIRAQRENTIYTELVLALQERGAAGNAPAIACGILGNILQEVGGAPYNYDPTTVGDYVAGAPTSGGICGWHNENFDKMTAWCKRNGYPWFDLLTRTVYLGSEAVGNVTEELKFNMLRGQARYILYDLYESGSFNDTRPRILAVENDLHGAWYVGYIFCCMYERPQNYWVGGIGRGSNAQAFWKKYVDKAAAPVTSGDPAASTLQIAPTTLPYNNSSYYGSFIIRGTVRSNYPISAASVYVTDAAGNTVIGYGPNSWDSRTFDIRWDGPDNNLAFRRLSSPGSYTYCIDARDVSGKAASFRHIFYVVSPTRCTYAYQSGYETAFPGGTVDFGGTITLPTPDKRPGYLFDGWHDGSALYAPGSAYQVLQTAVTFTGRWSTCPHAHWEKGAVTPPEVGKPGYTTYTCPDCGLVKQDDFTDPLPSDLPGDVDQDGRLTEQDLHLLGRHVAQIELLPEGVRQLADVNGDKVITAADLTALAALLKK